MSNEISDSQKQTQETFGFKWHKRDTYESEAVKNEWKRWLLEKYFDDDASKLVELLGDTKKRILDAGCGGGMSGFLLFGDYLKGHEYIGVDISDAVLVAEERFKANGIDAEFIKSDLNNIPEELGLFDVIFSEGVLHHTDSVENAISVLSKRLDKGGAFLFYVYIKKAPIREFTDDFIRNEIAQLNDEDAWNALEPLTKLGKVLGDLNIEIDVPEDIPYLGIPKGKCNLQRLFFYKIFKAYYQPDYTIDEMNHINFDWFRPTNCYRHTPEEIRGYCEHSNLDISRMHIGESGITVIATKV